MRLLVDKASIELFEGSGETVMTNLVFPSEPYNQLRFYATGKPFEVKTLRCYALD